MNNLVTLQNRIPAMSDEVLDKIYKLEGITLALPQVQIDTAHLIHGGMYARTITIPADTVLTGALIKIATILIIQGDVRVFLGDDTIQLKGYNVIPASAHRKQAFYTETDVHLTMIFPTKSRTVAEAEKEFTDETHLLISQKDDSNNKITITEE